MVLTALSPQWGWAAQASFSPHPLPGEGLPCKWSPYWACSAPPWALRLEPSSHPRLRGMEVGSSLGCLGGSTS